MKSGLAKGKRNTARANGSVAQLVGRRKTPAGRDGCRVNTRAAAAGCRRGSRSGPAARARSAATGSAWRSVAVRVRAARHVAECRGHFLDADHAGRRASVACLLLGGCRSARRNAERISGIAVCQLAIRRRVCRCGLCLDARRRKRRQHQGQRGHQGGFLHRPTRFCCGLAALLWDVSLTFLVIVSFEPDWRSRARLFKTPRKEFHTVALRGFPNRVASRI